MRALGRLLDSIAARIYLDRRFFIGLSALLGLANCCTAVVSLCLPREVAGPLLVSTLLATLLLYSWACKRRSCAVCVQFHCTLPPLPGMASDPFVCSEKGGCRDREEVEKVLRLLELVEGVRCRET